MFIKVFIFVLTISFGMSISSLGQYKPSGSVLDSILTTKVYLNENLEGVVLRLTTIADVKVGFRPNALSHFSAKKACYNEVTLRFALDDQFKDKLIKYRLRKGNLELYFIVSKLETNDKN